MRTASRTLAADAVVVNADFAQAMQRMVPDSIRRRWTNSRIEKKRFSCSTFMLYLGIEGRYDEVLTTRFTSPQITARTCAISSNSTSSRKTRPSTCRMPRHRPQLAPKKMSTLYMLLPVTHEHRNVDWDVERARFRSLAFVSWRRSA